MGATNTPRVDALTAEWNDDGATLGAAYIKLRDLARELEAKLAAAPASTEQAAPVVDFSHLAGRGMHELRTDELPAYLVSVGVSYGPRSAEFVEAATWVASELERKTNDERGLAVQLAEIREAAPTPSAETIDSPEFREIVSRVQGWKNGHAVMQLGVQGAATQELIAHIDARMASACREGRKYQRKVDEKIIARLRVQQPAQAVAKADQPELTVWYGPMPESNGKSNFTAILRRKGDITFDNLADGITIERSEYPDRVRYEADRVRYLIGELAERPFILDYDAEKHSGYVAPLATHEGKAGDGLEPLPEGWEASHMPPWDALTPEAQDQNRFMVKRLVAPFCDKQNRRVWVGPTLASALAAGNEALGLPQQQQAQQAGKAGA